MHVLEWQESLDTFRICLPGFSHDGPVGRRMRTGSGRDGPTSASLGPQKSPYRCCSGRGCFVGAPALGESGCLHALLLVLLTGIRKIAMRTCKQRPL